MTSPYVEEALVFPAAGETLVGVVARPRPEVERAESCGVLIIVGGPQYRTGSHRQFLLLSRRLAAQGYPTMRFDYRGMGDSSGAMQSFDDVSADVAAAIDAFFLACPGLKHVVLWGLCDAASAALLYVQERGGARVAGLVLLNPWVRSAASLAQTHLKHYYGQRLLQAEFWRKLFSGRMQLANSLCGFVRNALVARGSATKSPVRSFQDRMADGLRQFPGKVLLLLSGEDYTAKEFIEYTAADPEWHGLLSAPAVTRVDLVGADHTFSSAAQRAQVEEETIKWLGGRRASPGL